MCDPLSIGAAVLGAGSMVANSGAQDAVNGARTGVFNTNYGQQEGFQNQIDNVNTKSQNLFATAPQDMASKTSDVANFYKSTGGAAPQSGPTTGTLPGESSDILTQDAGRQNGKVAAFTGQQQGALAAMRGLGDTLGGDARGVALNTANTGVLQSDKSGVASLLPVELANANNAGNSDKMLGDLLGGLSKVAMAAGLSPYNPFRQDYTDLGYADSPMGVTGNLPGGNYGDGSGINIGKVL